MDFLFVDSARRMDPDYIREWWDRFYREESICSEIGVPMPDPPWNAPGWPIDEAQDPEPVAGTGMDPDQSRVVMHPGGPALVMAGAGSGKTRTIVARVVHLLQTGTQPGSILCLTFTKKAAREMKQRIEKEAGEIAKKITVSTFHALALDLIRTYPAACNRTANFSVWDDEVQAHEIKSIVKGHPNADPRDGTDKAMEWTSASDLSNLLDTLRENGETIPGKRFYQLLGGLHEQAWEVAMAYQELKETCNALDFADLVWIVTLQLLGPDSPHRANLQARWSQVIVDEYQDTNHIQELFLARLVEHHQNLMVVGDEDQAIYAFRGSDVGFIRTFPNRYAGCVTYLLGRNYRSTPNVVDAANALISQNKKRHYKRVWSEAEEGRAIAVGRWFHPNQEAQAVATEIGQARQEGWSDDELAVLVRTRRQFLPIQAELQRRKIPYHTVGDLPWYARADAKILLAWMRAVINPRDLDAGAATLKSWDGLGNGTVEHWKKTMASLSEPMFSRLRFLHGKPGLGQHTKRGQRLMEFAAAWERWDRETVDSEESLRDRVQGLLQTLGIVQQIVSAKLSQKPAEVEEANRREIFLQTLLSILPDEPESGRWSGIRTWMDELFTNAVVEEKQEGVCLSTIHGSKGLEWGCVWLPGWCSSVFPSERANSPAALEEERRLAYVAVTRAKHRLSVSGYANSSIPVPKEHTPSIFLQELNPAEARGPEWTQTEEPRPFVAPVVPPPRPIPVSAWVQPAWFIDHFGESSNTIPDEDQPEFGWYGWNESIEQISLQLVEIHAEDSPIKCVACNRFLRVSVSLRLTGTGLPASVRMGRRCAARLLGNWGKIFDATRAADEMRLPIRLPSEKAPVGNTLFVHHNQPREET